MSQRLISPKALLDKGITYSRVQRWRLERDGKFPRRVRLSHKKCAYVESEIDAFVAAKIAERDLSIGGGT